MKVPHSLSYYVHLVGTFAVCWISCKWILRDRVIIEGSRVAGADVPHHLYLLKIMPHGYGAPAHTSIHTYNYMKFSWKFRTLTASPANRHSAPLRGIIEAKCIWSRRRHASLPDLINGNVLNGFLWQLVVVISGNHKRVRVPVHDASHHTQ